MTTPLTSTLTLTMSTSSPPPPPYPPKLLNLPSTPLFPPSQSPVTRRHATLLAALLPCIALSPPPASAFEFGISGPKDWLKEQKKKSIKYILAPIDASREILTYAHQLLLASDNKLEQKDLGEILENLKSAARDCVADDRSSIVAFQAKSGVEVCTFKLLVSNASSLLNDNDPAKLEAEARLNDLIRSFSFLNGVAKEANIQLVSDRQKVADALTDTLSSLHNFEQGIKECIGV